MPRILTTLARVSEQLPGWVRVVLRMSSDEKELRVR